MKKLSTQITTDDGEQTISVWLDDETACILGECKDERIIHDYIVEEYRASLLERKETRRHQSLENSTDNGFDIADESQDVESEIMRRIDAENLHKAITTLEPQQQWLIQQIYFEGRSKSEIASELHVVKSAISNRLKKIFAKIKKFLE